MLPVSDLASSAAWYRDLLGLEYAREFERDGVVTGCALLRGPRPLRDLLPAEEHDRRAARSARRAPDRPARPRPFGP
ncbi:VOC family protein [Nonomuraea sp. NPDC049480]|uniref:VOC family protein n=1 Tax=Nonomuraea sp. NPDC049480 TaxID=3364353 RepID=UPI003796C3B9